MSLLLGMGGGLMHRIKIPRQDFVLKMQGGLCAREGGGCICGRLRYIENSHDFYLCIISILAMIYAFLSCQHFQPHTPSAVDDDNHEDNDQPEAIVR